MKIQRTSGLPLMPEDVPKYHADLEAGMETLKTEMGPFEKLPQDKQGEFMKRFEEMRESVLAKYKTEDELDVDVILSKTKLKELVNRFGIIAFTRDPDGKSLACFVVDSKF